MDVESKLLSLAWQRRTPVWAPGSHGVIRVFHGPGEGTRHAELNRLSVDLFGDGVWLTSWTTLSAKTLALLQKFYSTKGVLFCVHQHRPDKGPAPDVSTLWGVPPAQDWVQEPSGVRASIRFEKTKQPGLFLDHEPLRRWLIQNSKDKTVLNTFAFTGSLSVAAALGGASKVTTLDLSKPFIEWAKSNWALNELPDDRAEWWVGDALKWLPQFAKKGRHFDQVILDPPSFSRAKTGTFSTQKDYSRLLTLAMALTRPGSQLIGSLNSENRSWPEVWEDFQAAAAALKQHWIVLKQIEQPESFPTALSAPETRYLKGLVLERV